MVCLVSPVNKLLQIGNTVKVANSDNLNSVTTRWLGYLYGIMHENFQIRISGRFHFLPHSAAIVIKGF